MKCLQCGQPRPPDALGCANCGVGFDHSVQKVACSTEPDQSRPSADTASAPVPAAIADATNRSAKIAKPSYGDPVADEPKPCPKCGYKYGGQAVECLRCGIIFGKYEVYLEKRRRAVEETNQTTDSLIDPETVKMAVGASCQRLPAVVYARTACPHCAQRYKIRTDQVGILTRCKKCSSIFKIEQLPDIVP